MNIQEQFFSLTPDRVLDAVEAGGTPVTGLCYPLNSLENRVYELEREDRTRVVAKFYRPGRWSQDAILDEHRFLLELIDAEVPVCPPLPFPDGETLRQVSGTGIWYALFPRVGGRAPEEFDPDQLRRLGALLARIHTVGAAQVAPFRRPLTPETYGRESLEAMDKAGVIPLEEGRRFHAVVEGLMKAMTPLFEGVAVHRVHGDCHPGNLLWGSQGPFFLDFDDLVTGPAVQDIWMLVPGRDRYAVQDRDALIEGYTTLRDFDRRTLRLIEPLRALRYLHYAAWITRRWEDPSFPRAFPHYGTPRYWSGLLQDLEEQLELIGGEAPAGSPTERARLQVEVRPVSVESDEFQRVLAIRTEVFVEELGRDLDVELDGQDRSAIHLLAVDGDGRAVGCARLRSPGLEGWMPLDRVAVMPGFRKRGFGRALVQQAESHARAGGATGLVIDALLESVPFFGTLDFLATSKPRLEPLGTIRRMVREWGAR